MRRSPQRRRAGAAWRGAGEFQMAAEAEAPLAPSASGSKRKPAPLPGRLPRAGVASKERRAGEAPRTARMSISKGTAQAIAPRKTEALIVSLSGGGNDSSSGSTPPDKALTAKPSSESLGEITAKGRVSRSNSMQDIQHIQHELKSGGDLVFAPDSSGAPALKGGNFPKLVEWVLASASAEDRVLQNFVLAFRQWRPPTELWKIVMDKYAPYCSFLA